jgi:hypothetical protein
VAAGALWPGFEILAVKRPPNFRERSGAVIRANSGDLILAQMLTGCLKNAVGPGCGSKRQCRVVCMEVTQPM